MKKLLTALSAITLMSSSVTSTISCNSHSISSIFLITDTGKITDRSFNESGYNAGNVFARDVLGMENGTISYFEPSDINMQKKAYGLAAVEGAKIEILPGFSHQENLPQVQKALKEDGTAIFIDGTTELKYPNVIGMNYKSDVSGFLVGMASIIWYFQTKPNETKVNLATYGGMPNQIAVTPYMMGFLASIDAFNICINDPVFRDTFKLTNKDVKASRISAQAKDPLNANDRTYFTESFDAGGARDISNTFLNGSNNANIIFPVAGPQIADTLGAIQELGKSNAYVDGVDTDQVTAYPNYKNYFISSGMKNIIGSTVIAIMHSTHHPKGWDKNFTQDFLEQEEAKTEIAIDSKTISIPTNPDGSENTDSNEQINSIDYKWDGKNIWFGGSFSSGGDNKVSVELHDSVNAYFFPPLDSDQKGIDLTTASKNYFDEALAPNSPIANPKDGLSAARIKAWLKDAKILK